MAQLAPPAPLSAARRTAGLVKYLARLGHRVTVLSSLASGPGAVPGAARSIKTRDLMASPLNWRRASFESLKGEGEASYSGASRVASWVVPDLALAGWLPFVLPRALAAARSADCVITSSPPPSAHLVGLALRRRGVPWIADFRDGWTFEPVRAEWPLAAQDRLDRALERAVARGADVAVAVTRPIAADLGQRFGIEPVVITNGFDPEESRAGAPEHGALSPERYSIVHTGRMEAAGRTPAPLLDALRLLRARSPELAGRIELVFAGPVTDAERELLAAPDLEGAVRWVGSLDRDEALGLQRAADALLVLAGGFSTRSVATGKLYEYLAACRPILVLGSESEAARIVEETGAGLVASASDPEEIAATLRTLVEQGAPTAEAGGIERFSYERLAVELSEQVERAVAGQGRPAAIQARS